MSVHPPKGQGQHHLNDTRRGVITFTSHGDIGIRAQKLQKVTFKGLTSGSH